MHYYILISIMR